MKNTAYTENFITKEEFSLLKLNCASCAARVEKVIMNLDGVTSVVVNFATLTAVVYYDNRKISPLQIKEAVVYAGYDMILDDGSQSQNELTQEYKSLKIKTLFAVILSIPAMIIGMFFMEMPYANIIMWVTCTPVIFWFGRGFFISSFKQWRHLSFGMDTLVALSTFIAYIFSVFNTLYPQFWLERGIHPHVYYEAAAVIIAFVLLGRLLETKAKAGTSAALKKLIGLQPKTVIVIRDGEDITIPINNVKIGDIIIVKPGDKIAVDGVVIEGNSYVDESMLNGEPIPQLKVNGDNVFAGTINQKGGLKIQASVIGNQTMLAHIIELVKQAQGSKAPVQKLVDKIAGIFVPVVMGIAILSGVIWLIWGGENNITYALLSVVTVLIIACPCALGLATPTAIMVGIGIGAQKGILIKDAASLEIAKKVDTVVLDKTGTITEGSPVVTNVIWNENLVSKEDEQTLKDILYSIERLSEHPLAEAVCHYFNKYENVYKVSEFNSITGMGVQGFVRGKQYFIGTQKLLAEHNIFPDKTQGRHVVQMEREAKTIIWFADSFNVIAAIAIADKIKEGSSKAVSELNKAGIKVYMLTGDNENTARHIAAVAGISLYKASVMPNQKGEFIKELQRKGEVVAMVGDGINDSAALACADIGIAMGKGSDIAMDVAQMTIISSDLMKISKAIKLSALTVSTIKRNLFWAFIYNIIGIPIAAGILYPFTGFLLNPMIAGAAMAFSSVSVVCNSLLLGYIAKKRL